MDSLQNDAAALSAAGMAAAKENAQKAGVLLAAAFAAAADAGAEISAMSMDAVNALAEDGAELGEEAAAAVTANIKDAMQYMEDGPINGSCSLFILYTSYSSWCTESCPLLLCRLAKGCRCGCEFWYCGFYRALGRASKSC